LLKLLERAVRPEGPANPQYPAGGVS
jgi:hypothetical protein